MLSHFSVAVEAEELQLKFQTSHSRALLGNDVIVSVQADGDERIARVEIQLDRFTIADDILNTPAESYERDFHQVGNAGPGTEHSLMVSVVCMEGTTHGATTFWTDPS